MQAVILGLVAAASFGGVFSALRWAYKKTGVGSTQAAVISVTTAGVVVTVIALATGAFAEVTLENSLPYVVSGLFAPGLSHLAMYRSIDTFGGTRTAVVLGFVPVVAVLGAWILLGEAPGWLAAVGGLLVVAAGILIVDPRAAFQGRAGASPLLAFVAVLCFAGRDVTVRGADGALSAIAGSSLSLIVASVLLVGVNVARERAEVMAAIRSHLGPLLVPGLFMAIGFTALIAGFAQGRVAVVSTMAATQSVWSVMFARLLLDRSEWNRRIVVASLLATAGGIIVALGA
jgi:drug/metabolite transporter (DMT)-like permease